MLKIFLTNGYSPSKSNGVVLIKSELLAITNGTNRVLWLVLRMLSGEPGRFKKTSNCPFLEPFK